MRVMLLGFAAPLALAVAAISAAPAGAQSFAAGDDRRSDGTAVFSDGGSGRLQGCDMVREHRNRGRRGGRGGSCDISVGTWVNAGEWALYNNRTWESDSYNDWWHDRPDRAYPRWVSSNQDCARRWWQGGGWRC